MNPFNDPGGVIPGGGFRGFFVWAANLIIIIGLGILIVFVAMGFFKVVTSRGDKTELDSAKKMIVYAIIGGIALLAAYAIKDIVLGVSEVSVDPITG